jgi:hypothetical protein
MQNPVSKRVLGLVEGLLTFIEEQQADPWEALTALNVAANIIRTGPLLQGATSPAPAESLPAPAQSPAAP